MTPCLSLITLTNALGSYLGFSMDDQSKLGSDLWTAAAKPS